MILHLLLYNYTKGIGYSWYFYVLVELKFAKYDTVPLDLSRHNTVPL